jgi:hypothetical protein
MAIKLHEVEQYNYSFDASTGGPGRMQLWGPGGTFILEIRFVEDTISVPPPTVSEDLDNATAYFKRSELPNLVDLLRNEKPVFVTINDEPPGFVFVHSDIKRAGEKDD